MTTLTLVVNVLQQCKQGKIFPEHESEWPKTELIKVLALSGIVGHIPATYDYNDFIQLFLDHLNNQRPLVYALKVDHHTLILDSKTVETRKDLLYVGPYAKTLDSYASCESAWQKFSEYSAASMPSPIVKREGDLEAELDRTRIKLLDLQQENSKLKTSLTNTEGTRLKAQFDEANQLLKSFKEQIDTSKKKQAASEEINMKLSREAQVLEAQRMQYKTILQKLRDKLGTNWETSLDELMTVKRQLAECERKQQSLTPP